MIFVYMFFGLMVGVWLYALIVYANEEEKSNKINNNKDGKEERED